MRDITHPEVMRDITHPEVISLFDTRRLLVSLTPGGYEGYAPRAVMRDMHHGQL